MIQLGYFTTHTAALATATKLAVLVGHRFRVERRGPGMWAITQTTTPLA